MNIYLCPKCGAEMNQLSYLTCPPQYFKECPVCGYKVFEEKEKINYIFLKEE